MDTEGGGCCCCARSEKERGGPDYSSTHSEVWIFTSRRDAYISLYVARSDDSMAEDI